MAKSSKNPHRGDDFRDILQKDDLLEDVESLAWKRALALQLQQLIEKQEITKSEMATRMNTSRAAVDRLLDASNPSLTLATLAKAAKALGHKLSVKLLSA
jgi:antitoxin HicB